MELSADENPGATTPAALPAGPETRAGESTESSRSPDQEQGQATSNSGTDASRGQTDVMAENQGDANVLNQPRQPIVGGMGSRGGSPLGSQSEGTGMGDGQPSGSSQGLTGAQGSGGGAERGAQQNPGTGPDAGDR